MIEKLKQLLAPPADPSVKLTVVSLFLGRLLELYEDRIKLLEARQLERGEKGDTGPQGLPGRDGKDGKDGAPGPQGLPGRDGKDGKDGKPGKDGKDGVSVVDSEIALDGHLVLKLSNGSVVDAGPLPEAGKDAQVFVSGNAWQITVSATPPANPQINQLWLQIP